MNYQPVPTICLTNDKHLWLLKGFGYLLNRYWPEQKRVLVAGYGRPSFALPDNFRFYSISPENYPAAMWSDGLLKLLEALPGDYLVLMLEDYWLNGKADHGCIRAMCNLIQELNQEQPHVLRIDLTADRMSNQRAVEFGRHYGYDLIRTPHDSEYQMSYQVAVWDKRLLSQVLVRGENPWQSEVNGTKRLAERPDILVLGTRERPLKYRPVFRTHRHALDVSSLAPEDYEVLQQRGWLNHG